MESVSGGLQGKERRRDRLKKNIHSKMKKNGEGMESSIEEGEGGQMMSSGDYPMVRSRDKSREKIKLQDREKEREKEKGEREDSKGKKEARKSVTLPPLSPVGTRSTAGILTRNKQSIQRPLDGKPSPSQDSISRANRRPSVDRPLELELDRDERIPHSPL